MGTRVLLAEILGSEQRERERDSNKNKLDSHTYTLASRDARDFS